MPNGRGELDLRRYLFLPVPTYTLNISFDLQLFGGEKTEEPTAKKREEARNKGQVARSHELSTATGLLAVFATMLQMGPYLSNEMQRTMRTFLEMISAPDLAQADLSHLIAQFANAFLRIVMPILGVVLLTGLVTNVAQVGLRARGDGLVPDFKRLNPLTGFQRIFSKKSLVELVKSVFKLLIVGYVTYSGLAPEMSKLPRLMDMGLIAGSTYILNLGLGIGIRIAVALFILAVFDYFYQWWDIQQNLRMSKQEIKDEYKDTEGDPKIKGKIRERQRAMARMRMMQAVPQADVVITNPTHLAIALQYDIEKMDAPVVVAKGQDFVAQRIREIARENGVVVMENRPLAQALFKSTEIGDQVPAHLYTTVAEVLAFVYQLKKKAFAKR